MLVKLGLGIRCTVTLNSVVRKWVPCIDADCCYEHAKSGSEVLEYICWRNVANGNTALQGTWVSMGVLSDGSYGAPKDVIYSFPVTCKNGEWKIVQGEQCLQSFYSVPRFSALGHVLFSLLQ
jgi:hypothetical protein